MLAMNRIPGSASIRGAQQQGGKVARTRQFEWLARAGLAARALVYAVIGILALKLAAGDGGKASNQQGALKTIAQAPFGKILLVLVAIGLAGYALWRLSRAALGHGQEQRDSGFDRVSALASGIVYAALCVTAIEILTGAATSSGTPKKATGGILGWTGGPLIVGIAGAVLIGVGAYQAHKGYKKTFLEDSKTERMGHPVRRVFTAVGVFGHLARAVVFTLVGYGLIRAAIDYDPHKAVGLDGALLKLAHAPAGPWVLGIVAAGLLGFAAYSAMDARYRRI